jgi:hypothetical protein
MKSSQAVRKTRMLGGLVCEMSESELAYSPEPLELCRIDQTGDEAALRRCGFDPDYVVDRVAVNSFRQIYSPLA